MGSLQSSRTDEVHHLGEVRRPLGHQGRRSNPLQLRISELAAVLTDAELVGAASSRELAALEARRPRKSELEHQLLALTGGLAKGPTRRQRPFEDRADGRVHGAEEELDVGRAVDFDERKILVDFAAGVVLACVAHQVGEDGRVVGDLAADGDVDGLAPAMGNFSSQTCPICQSQNGPENQKFEQNHFALVCFHFSLNYFIIHFCVL